jgi:putative transposase
LHGIQPGELTFGSDNSPALTARRFRANATSSASDTAAGYRDPESQAFIESWFGKLKEREVWPNEYENLDDARPGATSSTTTTGRTRGSRRTDLRFGRPPGGTA